MQLGENLLVDACMIKGLSSIDHDQAIAQLALDDRLHNGVEEIPYGGVFG